MMIKYSPTKNKYDTHIEIVSENAVRIDGEIYDFDLESIEWPDVRKQSGGHIKRAYRQDGELWLVVRRYYASARLSWDTGSFHEVHP